MPLRLTSFVGRRHELDAVRQQLLLPEVRLLTLTGPAGTGKTRLALQAAAESADLFEDGVCFVDLAPISDASLVASAIGRRIGVPQDTEPTTFGGLEAFLHAARLLLVLDNFEQVVSAAPLVAELLAACPRLKVIVTSQVVLRIAAEHQFQVPPLRTPDMARRLALSDLGQNEAMMLFVERAKAVDLRFRLSEENAAAVAEICCRLDGLPLAIELAAARSKVLTPRALLSRLGNRLGLLTAGPRDTPVRHHTLRGAIDRSHRLLDQSEQALFRRLAVFVGGFTLPAVAAVSAMPANSESVVLDALAQLVDKNMLCQDPRQDGDPRFSMIETMREYALERLAASGELEDVQRRHALFFLKEAQTTKLALIGPDQPVWLGRLDDERDNFRAALRWCVENREEETGLQLAGALWRFWHVRGYQSEGRSWLARMLSLPSTGMPTATRATALHAAGRLACDQGDYLSAEALIQESLSIRRCHGNQRGIARSLVSLARIARDQGDPVRARRLLDEARPLIQQLGARLEDAISCLGLARLAHDQGDDLRARALYEQGLAGFAAVGNDGLTSRETSGHLRGVVSALTELGEVEISQGQLDLARSHLDQSWRIAMQLGDRLSGAHILDRMAGLVALEGEAQRAFRLAGVAATLRAVVDSQPSALERASLERWLEPARRILGEDAATAAYARGRALAPEQIVADGVVWDEMETNLGDMPPSGQSSNLTPRERQVALLIGRGLSNREIAAALVITRGTAANHVEHLLKKLRCKSRTQIATWVVEHDLHGVPGSD